MSDRAPDYIEPVLAWRSWSVDWAALRLCSIHMMFMGDLWRGHWDLGNPTEAVCLFSRCREVPGSGCKCGFYAMKDITTLIKAGYGLEHWENRVTGVVALSGKVIEHQNGYRAQFAQPVFLASYINPMVPRMRVLSEKFGLLCASYGAKGAVIRGTLTSKELDRNLYMLGYYIQRCNFNYKEAIKCMQPGHVEKPIFKDDSKGFTRRLRP
jgi:hypothetical protein